MLIKLVVGNKVHIVSKKMAHATLALAINKYKSTKQNAIVGVQKGDMLVLLKDTFPTIAELYKAVSDWEDGGYKCYHTKIAMEELDDGNKQLR